ncbi:hypothetical protein ACFFIF_01840 [Vagococcus entomophilus]|uniref:Uncharacterized protein n=1 Tax=Vagococcus entomophilus TaxID=1160095 RepID=A0A430AKM6_9ENTE|nr:hypothetical protein [Vagococcus entomophilus]RSU08457.1 hypothetical protein CBF30_04245 [Vagococcus entomophilus]
MTREEYLQHIHKFEGKLLDKESFAKFPESKEKEDIGKIVVMMKEQGFNPDVYRLDEIPIKGVYYVELAVSERGIDYFSIQDDGDALVPHYTTIKHDENGYNCFPCATIQESIDKMEC